MSEHFPRASVIKQQPIINVQMTASQFAHMVSILLRSNTAERVDHESVGDYISDFVSVLTECGYAPEDLHPHVKDTTLLSGQLVRVKGSGEQYEILYFDGQPGAALDQILVNLEDMNSRKSVLTLADMKDGTMEVWNEDDLMWETIR